MSHFINLDGPIFGLAEELDRMIGANIIEWHRNQICLTTTTDQPDNYKLGVGSLYHNWEEAKKLQDSQGNISYQIDADRTRMLREHDFTIMCTQFEGTEFQNALDWMKNRFGKLHRVRLMRMQPHACLSWHKDSSPRVHYPLITDIGAKMVVGDEAKHMPAQSWWWVDTTVPHTAFNATNEPRVHLVACIGN